MPVGETRTVEVNTRRYNWPRRPLVVVCIDGSEPGYDKSDSGGYIDRALAAGCMPYLRTAIAAGTKRVADCVVPSFTNPNNISIVTGVPPAVHGICGNFFYDPATDAEIMMNDPKLLRVDTIFASFQRQGVKVAVVTAKDKLRALLGNGLGYADGSLCFSAEKADEATLANNGVDNVLELVGSPLPSVYSAALSEFVFAAGVKLMESRRPDIMYLSTTDYVQHKHAPGTKEANEFYAMMDGYWGKLHAMDVTLALTADHGMKAKHDACGEPNVIYLQSLLDTWLGEGVARVICPITDPYVVHHGALGGFVTVYLADGVDVAQVVDRIASIAGIECAFCREDGAARFELPPDRIGDVLAVAAHDTVIGTTPERHDLSGLDAPLRSHGGLSEQRVPFLINRPTVNLPADKLIRNYDIFEIALNHAQ